MKKENDEITDLFRSRLGNAEMTVRDGFWEELNSEMMVRSHQLPYCWYWLLRRLLSGSSLRKRR